MGLRCLDEMVHAEPVIHVRQSISKIVAAVEQAISKTNDTDNLLHQRDNSANQQPHVPGPFSLGPLATPSATEASNPSAGSVSLTPSAHQAPRNESTGPIPVPLQQNAQHNDLWPGLDYVMTTDLFDFLPDLSDENAMDPFLI